MNLFDIFTTLFFGWIGIIFIILFIRLAIFLFIETIKDIKRYIKEIKE